MANRTRRRLLILAVAASLLGSIAATPAHAGKGPTRVRVTAEAAAPARAAAASAGPYVIIAGHTVGGSRKCLDVPRGTRVWGTRIIQWVCNGGTNQRWYFDWTDSGYAKIRNAASGLCLNVNGASSVWGTAIIQWDCVDNDNGQWMGFYRGRLDGTDVDYYRLFPRFTGNEMCLNVEGASKANGARLILWGCLPLWPLKMGNDDFTWRL